MTTSLFCEPKCSEVCLLCNNSSGRLWHGWHSVKDSQTWCDTGGGGDRVTQDTAAWLGDKTRVCHSSATLPKISAGNFLSKVWPTLYDLTPACRRNMSGERLADRQVRDIGTNPWREWECLPATRDNIVNIFNLQLVIVARTIICKTSWKSQKEVTQQTTNSVTLSWLLDKNPK